ncbi:ABC transporter transmembrane domain-containing protein [Acidipropionibacterium jensenii]|uniref:ABC transporter transmembrane domain-containing protein n=1 Tax=Acidipropionibacterium jensenii TaxID=1749 RepID=UPI00214A9036|nr:ABC transporter ATP-binding protein [Acidipropionibacterium jensenii]
MCHRGSALARSTREVRAGIALNICVDTVGSISYALLPALTGMLVDDVLIHHRVSLMSIAMRYLVLLLVGLLCEIVAQLIWWRVSVRFDRSAKQQYFLAFLGQPPEDWHSAEGAGAELSQVTNNVTKLEQDCLTPLVAVVKDCIAMLVYGVVLAWYTSPLIAVTVFAMSLVALAVPRPFRTRLSAAASRYYSVLQDYTTRIEEFLRARLQIPPRAQPAFATTHWSQASSVARARFGYGRRKTIADGASGTCTELVYFLSFVVAGAACLRGQISVGAVAATLGYAKAFLSPLGDVLYSINAIHSTDEIRAQFEAVAGKVSCRPTIAAGTDGSRCQEVSVRTGGYSPGSSVSSEDSGLVLPRLSLASGDKVLLGGPSGSGKTTLLKSIYFSPADSGVVTVAGGTLTDPRDAVFYSGDGSPVFHASFRDNATYYGAFDWDEALLTRLSGGTGLYQRLAGLPDITVASRGEKQFTLLARGLLSGSSVYLLDEAISAIDVDTGVALLDSFLELTAGASVVLVSHHAQLLGLDGWRRIELSPDHAGVGG